MLPNLDNIDMEKERDDPNACQDEHWRLRGACALFWHHDALLAGVAAWLRGQSDDAKADAGMREWIGWGASDGTPLKYKAQASMPWSVLVDRSAAPLNVRWFVGGRTNAGELASSLASTHLASPPHTSPRLAAAFNELDQHVLSQRGGNCGNSSGEEHSADAASSSSSSTFSSFCSEPEPHTGRPSSSLSLAALLQHSTLAAHALRTELGLRAGDRIGINLPNGLWAVVWVEGAKRAALPFCAIAAGTNAPAVADRLADTAATAFITLGGECEALEATREALSLASAAISPSAGGSPDPVSPADRSSGPQLILVHTHQPDALTRSAHHTAISASQQRPPAPAGGRAHALSAELLAPYPCHDADSLLACAHDAMHAPASRLNAFRRRQASREFASASASGGWQLGALEPLRSTLSPTTRSFVCQLWRLQSAVVVEASFPLLILYTSGSTGKPKGIVHVHGGYQVSTVHSSL